MIPPRRTMPVDYEVDKQPMESPGAHRAKSGWHDKHGRYVDPDARDLTVYLSPDQAAARARRSFWRGATFGGFLIASCFIGLAAFGETIQIGRTLQIDGVSHGATTVTIEPSPEPGQLAVVTMDNALVNDAGDNGEYVLALGDWLTVGLLYKWDANPFLGADSITLTPPAGIDCIPETCHVTVPEGGTGRIVLLEWMGY